MSVLAAPRMARPGPGPLHLRRETVRRRAGIVWNANQWADLQIKSSISSLRVLRLVDRLPRSEAEAAPLSVLAKDAEMSDSELRAALSFWLTRHLRSDRQVFPTDSWPFSWKVGPDVDPTNPPRVPLLDHRRAALPPSRRNRGVPLVRGLKAPDPDVHPPPVATSRIVRSSYTQAKPEPLSFKIRRKLQAGPRATEQQRSKSEQRSSRRA